MKSGFVSIIGDANVGKSTLINSIIAEKVSIVSYHPQTTRDKINGILTEERGQVVFVDTPGIHESRNPLSDYMLKSITSALDGVEAIIYVLALDKTITDKSMDNIKKLVKKGTPVIVALNKGDIVKVDKIASTIEKISSIEGIRAIIPISARNNKNVDLVIDEIFKCLPEGALLYPEDMYTDKSLRYMVAEIVREKAMALLKEEIPYGIAVDIDKYKNRDDGVVEIYASIVCEKKAHKQIVLGKSGSMIKKIATAARYEIEKLVYQKVYLDLFVKVKEDWRRSDSMVKLMGYDDKEI